MILNKMEYKLLKIEVVNYKIVQYSELFQYIINILKYI